MTKDELSIKIMCMVIHMKADLELGIAPDLKELVELTDMRCAFNEAH